MRKIFRNKKRCKGQTAVFLMLCLTLFCVLISILVNSSILTAQKIMLQNTADVAALVGSDLQRRALNAINEINGRIEDYWKTTQLGLIDIVTPLSDYCVAPSNSVITCATTACRCNPVCRARETTHRRKWIQGFYNTQRATLASNIDEIYADANKEAHKLVMDTIFQKSNIPAEIYNLINEHSGYPGATAMSAAYDSVKVKFNEKFIPLKEIYTITDYEEMPLWMKENPDDSDSALDDEERPFLKPTWLYSICIPTLYDPGCLSQAAVICGFNKIPTGVALSYAMPEKVKKLKDTTEETHYAVFLSYTPLHSFNFFNIPWKKEIKKIIPWLERQNEIAEERELFFEKRVTLTAMAIAKPVGGSVATGSVPGITSIGDFLNLPSRISGIFSNAMADMNEYTRNSLVGIADRNAIGIDLNRRFFKETDLKKEDIWH